MIEEGINLQSDWFWFVDKLYLFGCHSRLKRDRWCCNWIRTARASSNFSRLLHWRNLKQNQQQTANSISTSFALNHNYYNRNQTTTHRRNRRFKAKTQTKNRQKPIEWRRKQNQYNQWQRTNYFKKTENSFRNRWSSSTGYRSYPSHNKHTTHLLLLPLMSNWIANLFVAFVTQNLYYIDISTTGWSDA